MSGNSARIAAMPSSVHIASLRSSSLPVAMVKVSGSISRSDCGSPCRLQAKSTSRRAMRSLSSAVFAMPTSSMVSAITPAPNFFARISRSVAAFSPSSKLIELMIGFPPCSFSAASITGVSVLSITSGAFTDAVKRRITSFISCVSSRPTNAVQMSSACEPSPNCSRPWATQPSQSCFSCSSRHFFEPLALQRSPMAKIAFSCRSGTALYRLATQGTQTGWRATGAGRERPPASARLRSIASSAAMCVGGGAAAAADQVHAVLGDEAFQPARQFRRAERIVRVAIHQFRQPGIRQHRQ